MPKAVKDGSEPQDRRDRSPHAESAGRRRRRVRIRHFEENGIRKASTLPEVHRCITRLRQGSSPEPLTKTARVSCAHGPCVSLIELPSGQFPAELAAVCIDALVRHAWATIDSRSSPAKEANWPSTSRGRFHRQGSAPVSPTRG